MPRAQAALAHALAGDWDRAKELADAARGRLAQRAAEGKPESNASGIVEMLDLYDIVRLAHDGNAALARQNFAARSQWLTPGYGELSAVTGLLRAGAPADELAGGLAKTEETLQAERRDRALAARLENDKNNRTLWSRILPYASATSFERLSSRIWRGDKSRYISKKKDEKLDAYRIVMADADPLTQVDAMLLHSAIVAKARGYKGFSFLMLPTAPSLGWVRFANPGDAAVPDELFLDADTVIAHLRKVIPTPDEAEERRNARERALKKS